MDEHVMNCQKITATEIEDFLSSQKEIPIYQVEKGKSTGTVNFKINVPGFFSETDSETILFIDSLVSGGLVYHSTLRSHFSIEIDKRLLRHSGFDNLTFRFLRKKQGQICVKAQQFESEYWQPGSTVEINFLRNRYNHEKIHVPVEFEVTVEKP